MSVEYEERIEAQKLAYFESNFAHNMDALNGTDPFGKILTTAYFNLTFQFRNRV